MIISFKIYEKHFFNGRYVILSTKLSGYHEIDSYELYEILEHLPENRVKVKMLYMYDVKKSTIEKSEYTFSFNLSINLRNNNIKYETDNLKSALEFLETLKSAQKYNL